QGANKGKAESLTENESLGITHLFEKAASNLGEAWSTLVEIEPALQEFAVKPHFLHMVPPHDTVGVVSFSTQIGETSGMMNICIPHIMLEPIIPKLSGHYWLENASQERDLESYEDISRSLKKTEVEATALLGSANITLNELLHLKGDDVIALNQNIDEPLTFLINQEPKMLVQPGKIHNKTAVQVLEEIQGGEVDL